MLNLNGWIKYFGNFRKMTEIKLKLSSKRLRLQNVIIAVFLFATAIQVYYLVFAQKVLYYFSAIFIRKVDPKVSFSKFIINNKGCSIPDLKPIDRDNHEFVDLPKTVPKCDDKERALLKSNRTHVWIDESNLRYHIDNNGGKVVCCYNSFYRPVIVDDITSSEINNRVEFNGCRLFLRAIAVGEQDEFAKVSCFNDEKEFYVKFFLFAPKKQFKSEKTPYDSSENNNTTYNIIVLGIDAVSRLNFHRTMPKTLSFVKKLRGIEIVGYNTLGALTLENVVPLLTGLRYEELKDACLPRLRASTQDNCPYVWHDFKKSGYYTALGEDRASYDGPINFGVGFAGMPTDYYTHTFVHQAIKHFKIVADDYSPRCMGDVYPFEIILDYIESLTISLRQNRLFGFFWEVSVSHEDANDASVMDDGYMTLLSKLNSSGTLQDTMIILLSDHGMKFGKPAKTQRGRLEVRLPFVYVIPPLTFARQYKAAYKNLHRNSRRLITAFDLHKTLLDLAGCSLISDRAIRSRIKQHYAGQKGISLFLPIPSNRTCQMAGISDQWCTCYQTIELAVDQLEAYQSSETAVKYLNKLIKNEEECAQLQVLKVERFVSLSPTHEKSEQQRVRVTWLSRPGGGLFEATLSRDNVGDPWQLSGSVDRINRYGNQSVCLRDKPHLKPYCYCI